MFRSLPPLYVLRHGETEWNRAGRLQGHLDSPLTPTGVAQAMQAGEILARHLPEGATAITSDSVRCLRTADLALAGLGLVPRPDARLREVALGEWQGLTLAEIVARRPGETEDGDPNLWKFEAPGGETLAEVTARAASVLAGLSGPAVLITHGVTSRVLRCLALGRPPSELSALPGGQGVVHVIEGGRARVLTADTPAASALPPWGGAV